jgi:hypothetical protein
MDGAGLSQLEEARRKWNENGLIESDHILTVLLPADD